MKAPDPGGGKPPNPMRYAGLGIQLAVTLVISVLAGRWVDGKLGTGGIFTIIAAFLGFGGAMYSMIRQLNRPDGNGRE